MKQQRSEKSIESSLIRRVKKAGGICIKQQHTGFNGFPDRLIILPPPSMGTSYTVYHNSGKKIPMKFNVAQIWFVEFKKPGKDLSKLQKYWAKHLKKLGCNHFSILDETTLKEFYELAAI